MRYLIILLGLAMSMSSYANDNPNYKTWNSFNNDSISYLKENFDNSEYYVGKPLKCLFDDLEIQIKSCVFCPDFFCGRNLHDAILYFEEDKIVSKAIYEKKGRSLLTLYVSFQPISMVEYKQYEAMIRKARKNNEVNSDTEWDLFEKAFLGNRIITKICVPDVVR